jgi:hypothetical protein
MASVNLPQDIKTDVLQTVNTEMKSLIDKAAELVLNCEAILFTSGAGMGVSSGLGTFRGIAAGVKRWSELNHVKYSFSFTSNIDGHWIKSGLESISSC